MDIASLGFSIDTSDVSKAETALDGLNQAGAKTEAAAKGVGSAWSEASGKAGSASQAMRQGNEAIQAQQQELGKLLGQINPVIAALDRLDEQEKQLSSFRASGLLDAETFTEYQGRITQARNGLTAFESNLKRTGVSSAQTAAALRQLPAQFTDIFTSLASGQAPFTVLLQQGGQIKDAFGGIGPALAETGRYVAGLVNPLTLAAAAAVALAVAYKQGSDEATAYNKALILTGNAAGTNASNLASMAQAIDGTVGTQRQAAAALVEVANAGKFTADQLQGIALAAVAMEEATGKAVSDTVSEFKRLADEPAAASAKLNEQYHYLTASVYDQIRALEEQGDAAGAAQLAIESFGSAMQQRANEIEGSLGLIDRAWRSIKDSAAEAWDEMLGVGRPQTIDEQLERLNNGGFDLGKLASNAVVLGPIGGAYELYQQTQLAAKGLTEEGRKQIDQQLNHLELLKEEEAGIARQQGLLAQANDAAIKAQSRIDKLDESTATNAEKRSKALKQLHKDLEAIRQVNPGDSRLAEDNVAKLEADIAAKYKDPKTRTPKTKAFQDDAATKLLLSLREQEAALSAQLVTEGRLTAEQKKRAEFEQQIADLKTKTVLTADQQSLLANQDAIRAQLDKNVAIAEEVKLRKEAADEAKKLAAFEQTLGAQLARAKDSLDLGIAGQGLGSKRRERLQEQIRIEQEFARQQSSLQEQFNRGDISESLYESETQVIQQSLDKRLALQKDYYAQLDIAQGDWRNGASDAMQDYIDEAENISKQTYSLFKNALGEAEDVFVQFATTGKASFSDLFNSIAADVARMGFRSLIAEALSLGGAGAGTGTGGAGTGGLLTSLFSVFAGMYDTGGTIPAGQWGIVGERGPEIVSGPANVTSRADTARMMGGTNNVTINLSGISNAQEAREASASIQRAVARGVSGAGRYT